MLRNAPIFLLLALGACSGVRSAMVVPVQSKDKQLTCKEILLELNEAEEYKVAAEKNRQPDVRSFLAPLGYMYTLTSAADAIQAANERIQYLNEVYGISGCTGDQGQGLTEEQLRGHTFTGGYPTPRNGGR